MAYLNKVANCCIAIHCKNNWVDLSYTAVYIHTCMYMQYCVKGIHSLLVCRVAIVGDFLTIILILKVFLSNFLTQSPPLPYCTGLPTIIRGQSKHNRLNMQSGWGVGHLVSIMAMWVTPPTLSADAEPTHHYLFCVMCSVMHYRV